MKGFELCFNGSTKKIAVNEGVLSIIIFSANGKGMLIRDGKGTLTVKGTDYSLNQSLTWCEEELKLGDKIHIKFGEINSCSEPVLVADIKENRSERKLEIYHRLKEYLIKKGVL